MSQPESSACLSSGKRTFSSEVSGGSAAPTFAMSGTSFARSYGLWQYTSDGAVDGISGRVDLDYAYKNYPNIMRVNGLNGFKKEGASAGGSGSGFTARMMVTLDNTPLYVSATAKTPAAHKSGTFYLYDGKEISGRYRITNSPSRAGKTPISENVTGYVNKADLR